MDKVTVINLTNVAQHVGVIHADGAKDCVQIVPKRKVELRVGMTVDPAWLGLNINVVQVRSPVPVPRTYVTASTPAPSVPTPPSVVTPERSAPVADVANKEGVDK
jgi:hypothetical protein